MLLPFLLPIPFRRPVPILPLPFERERPIRERFDCEAKLRRLEFGSTAAKPFPEFDEPERRLTKLLRRPPVELPRRSDVPFRPDRENALDERERESEFELFRFDPNERRLLPERFPLNRLVVEGRVKLGATLRIDWRLDDEPRFRLRLDRPMLPTLLLVRLDGARRIEFDRWVEELRPREPILKEFERVG